VIEQTVEGKFTPEYTTIELQIVGATQQITNVQVDGVAVPNIRYEGDVMVATIPANFKQVKVGI
jgi:hypothetical protein